MLSVIFFHELNTVLLQTTSQPKSILDFLEKSIEEHSLIWLISSATAGAFTASFFKLFFEEIFPSRFRKRSLIIATKRQYSIPLLLAAAELRNRLGNMITHIKQIEKDGWLAAKNKNRYYYVSTLYLVGKFFGWVQVLRSTVVYLDMASVRETRRFENYIDLIEKSFSKPTFLPCLLLRSEKNRHWCYSHELTAMGEVMVHSQAENNNFQVIGYSKFKQLLLSKPTMQNSELENILFVSPNSSINLAEKNNEFKSWFSPLQHLFLELSENQESFLRIVAIHCVLNDFVNYLDPKYIRAKPKPYFIKKYLDHDAQDELQRYLLAVDKKSKSSEKK